MGKEYFKTQTEYIEFDSDTNIVTTISDNPEIGCILLQFIQTQRKFRI